MPLIYKPSPPWTHGMLPVVQHLKDDLHCVYFGMADEKGRQHIWSMEISINDTVQPQSEPTHVLGPRGSGYMRDGVSPTYARWTVHGTYLYFMGWRKTAKGNAEMAGLALFDEGKLRGLTEEPIFPKPKAFSVAVCTCLEEPEYGLLTVYYDCAEKYVNPKNRRYSVHQRTYYQGVWLDQPTTVFPQIGNESRTSCFRVLGDRGWFCAAEGESREYHIWEAVREGGQWRRKEELKLRGDWCNLSQCYPFPVLHKGKTYLFFSGDDYGRGGFGYEEV